MKDTGVFFFFLLESSRDERGVPWSFCFLCIRLGWIQERRDFYLFFFFCPRTRTLNSFFPGKHEFFQNFNNEFVCIRSRAGILRVACSRVNAACDILSRKTESLDRRRYFSDRHRRTSFVRRFTANSLPSDYGKRFSVHRREKKAWY